MCEWTIVDTFYSKDSYMCEHCGRVIKNIAIIKSNITGDTMKVGLTCLEKIMKLNKPFYKALQVEIKRYYKTVAEYEKSKNLKENYTLERADNKNNDKNNQTIAMLVIKNLEISLYRLIEDTTKLNKFSKTGLIKLQNLEELKKENKRIEKKFSSGIKSISMQDNPIKFYNIKEINKIIIKEA